jgi:Transcription initiation factor IIF, alpha subunit (TFIIF-alpha)
MRPGAIMQPGRTQPPPSRPPHKGDAGISSQAPPKPLKCSEFRLKSYRHGGEERHVMMLPDRGGFNFNELVQPVKLFRKPFENENSSFMKEDRTALEIGGQTRRKQKTQVLREWLSPDELEARKLDSQPWLLEDSDGRGWQGRLEGGLSQRKTHTGGASKYVLFVNQGNEFRVVPISKWYRFSHKITYNTLPLEEAEVKVGVSLYHIHYHPVSYHL